MRLLLIGSLSVLLAGLADANAQSFQAEVDATASSSSLTLDAELQTDGTLQGNFDPDSNPGGTQTRPGLFGGSGNQPIPITLDLLLDSGGAGAPAGQFGLELDLVGQTGLLMGLDLALAPGQAFATDVQARLGYATFNTVSPTCSFPSVGAVTLPIGELGQIRDLHLLQTDPATLALTPTDDPDRFDLEVAVPALVSLVVDTGVVDDPLPLEDLPVVLALEGQLLRIDAERIEITLTLSPEVFEDALDLEGVALPPVPLPLPCALPPGEEANVIFNLAANDAVFAVELGFELTAEAMIQAGTADPIFSDAFQE
ncbi:MAG: hypothetical protein ACXIUL_14045 [Wenzhouxiangella sp.]